MWDEVDVLLTSNPSLIKNKPKDKTVVKYKTQYNNEIDCEYEIDSLKQFDLIIEKLK